MPTSPGARFKIRIEFDGLPVEFEVEGKAADLRALIDQMRALVAHLKAIGAKAPVKASPTEN